GREPDAEDRADALLHGRHRPGRRSHRLRHAGDGHRAGAAGRFAQPVRATAPTRSRPMSAGPLLDVRHVTQRFGGLVANADVSMTVARGEMVGLIGPNGAGKSTLFNLIAGVMRPTEGAIWFDGEDVTALPATARCARGSART